MILYKKPDYCISFHGKKIKLRPEFCRVLQCNSILSDPILGEADKLLLCLNLLIKYHHQIPKDISKQAELFQVIFKFLSDSGEKQGINQKVFDFEQDAAYIYAAFYQCYQIDLHSRAGKKLHWHQFISLFNSLPENTRIMEIISIRSRPMPKTAKYNVEERQSLARLKALYRLELSEEERKKHLEQGLAKMAAMLQTMANEKR